LATADGVLRIMGDRHYLSDVLAGGALGFAFGYGVPTLLHYSVPLTGLTLAPMKGSLVGISAFARF
jgi:membrane-associated phospholipid phosphatase